MKFKTTLLIIIATAISLQLNAMAMPEHEQQASNSTFEGKVSYIYFTNIDKKTARLSSGMGYNGAKEIDVYMKGDKVLIDNKSLLYKTLYDGKKGTVTIWSDRLGKGQSYSLDEYYLYMGVFRREPRYIKGILWYPGITLSFDTYKIVTVTDTLTAFGHPSKFQRARLENRYAGIDIEFESLSSMKISKATTIALQYGLDSNTLPIKIRWTIDVRGVTGKMKGYEGLTATDIQHTELNDDIFSIPSDIKVESKKFRSINGFYKKIAKDLKKNKLYPDQRGEEVTYELNENEWDY